MNINTGNIIIDILIFVFFVVGIGRMGMDIMSRLQEKSPEEIIDDLYPAIKEIVIYEMSHAEIDWELVDKSGSIKRSQVIERVYEKFPQLNTIPSVLVIDTISKLIDANLEKVTKVVGN